MRAKEIEKFSIPTFYNGCKVIVSATAPHVSGDLWIGTWTIDIYGRKTIYLEKKYIDQCIKKRMKKEILTTLGHESYEVNKAVELAKKKYPTINPYLMAEKGNVDGLAHELTVKEFDKMSEKDYNKHFDKTLDKLGF